VALAGAASGRTAEQADAAQPKAPPIITADTLHPDDGKLRIIQLGAHPDDCEIRAGGVGAMWAAQGHHVQFVSLTNGDIGHWQMAGGPLAKRRAAEVEAAGKVLGIDSSITLDIHDGELMPTLENRKTVVRLIRRWNADIVIGHRPADYHPDHRYTGILMQDAAYMVSVPHLCPDVPPLRGNPVFLYSYDRFQRPNPFRPDVVVAIDAVIDKKVDALMKIESQFIEGGCNGWRSPLPDEPGAREKRRRSRRESFKRRFAAVADRCRDELIKVYGEEKGQQVRYAEAFEICEYGRRPSPEELRKLFPFLPPKN
jgi:LmbE family N-acetylglucosaminyl deacetylase